MGEKTHRMINNAALQKVSALMVWWLKFKETRVSLMPITIHFDVKGKWTQYFFVT